MKHYVYRHEGDSGYLTFFGEALIVSIHHSEILVVNFRRVTKLDSCSLQQICIAHRIARNLKKRLVLTGHYTNMFRKVAHDAGYTRHLGCVMS
jgi:hypothetical protein